MRKNGQALLSGIAFLAICFAGMVIDSSILTAVASLGAAVVAVAGMALLERIEDEKSEEEVKSAGKVHDQRSRSRAAC